MGFGIVRKIRRDVRLQQVQPQLPSVGQPNYEQMRQVDMTPPTYNYDPRFETAARVSYDKESKQQRFYDKAGKEMTPEDLNWQNLSFKEKIKKTIGEIPFTVSKPTLQLAKGVGGAAMIAGAKETGAKIINKADELERDVSPMVSEPATYKEGETIFNNPKLLKNPEYYTRSIIGQMYNIPLMATTGMVGVGLLEAGGEMESRFKSARAKGKQIDFKDQAYAATIGVVNGYLEKVGFDAVFRVAPGTKKAVTAGILATAKKYAYGFASRTLDAARGVSTDMLTEYLQEAIPVIGAKVLYAEGGTLMEAVKEANKQGLAASSEAFAAGAAMTAPKIASGKFGGGVEPAVREEEPTKPVISPQEEFKSVVRHIPDAQIPIVIEASSRPINVENVQQLSPDERQVIGIALNTAMKLPGADTRTIQNNILALESTGIKIPVTEIKEKAPVTKPTTTPVPATQVQKPATTPVEKTPVEKPVLPAEKSVTKKEVEKIVEAKPPIQEGVKKVVEKPKIEEKIELDVESEEQYKLLTELELAEPGQRFGVKDENGYYAKTIGIKSTFPKWLPEEYKKSKVVQPVVEHIKNETIPKKAAEVRLYNLLAKRLAVKEVKEESPEIDVDKIFNSLEKPNEKIQETGREVQKTDKNLFGEEVAREKEEGTQGQVMLKPELTTTKPLSSEEYQKAAAEKIKAKQEGQQELVASLFESNKEKLRKVLSDKKTEKILAKVLKETNPFLRRQILTRDLLEITDQMIKLPGGLEAKGTYDPQESIMELFRGWDLKRTAQEEIMHFAASYLTLEERQKMVDYFNKLSVEERRDILGKDNKGNWIYDNYYEHYNGNKEALAEEIVNHLAQNDDANPIAQKIRSIYRAVVRFIYKLTGLLDKMNSKFEARALFEPVFSQDPDFFKGRFQTRDFRRYTRAAGLTTEKGTLRIQKVFESAWEKLYNEKPPFRFSEISDIRLLKGKEMEITEKEFLEKGYKTSFVEGKRVERAKQAEVKQKMREKGAKKRKELRAELKKMFKEKTASTQEFKSKAVDYIKTNLPEKIRGKYLVAVKNVRTPKQLQKILDSVDRRRDTYERKLLVGSIEKIADRIEKLPVDIQRTIIDITSQIELKRHTQKLLDRLQKTREYLDTQTNDFGMPRRVLNELGILKRTPFNEVTTSQLIGINNKFLQLQNVGLNIMKDVAARKVKTHMETLAELEKGSVNLDVIEPSRKVNPFAADKIKRSEKVKDSLARTYLATLGIDRIFNKADGRADYTGVNYRTFKEPVDRAWNTWKYRENQISMAFYKTLNDLKLTEENSRRIAIYAYKVQRGGMEKLMEGRKLTKEQIESIKLDEKELAVYNWMRRRLDELHEALTEKMEKENNVQLGFQENYFPMITDYGVTKPLIEEFQAENRLKSVPFGSIEERKAGARQTLKLDAFQTFGSYVGKSTYFIAMDNTIQKLTRLAETERYRKTVGENMQRAVLTWLDVLTRKGGPIVRETAVWRKVNELNNNLSVAILGLRITSTLKQPLALLDGMAEIGHYALQGAQKIMNDNWMSFMTENSSEIRERFADPFLEEISHDKRLRKVKKVAMYPLQKLDNLTARSVWAGAYMKKMDELGLEIDLKSPNQEALSYADLVMRKTQASPAFKDLPTMMTGKERNWGKLIMKFQTFILNRWSYIAEDLPDKMKNNKTKAVQQLTFLAIATMLEGAINTIYYNLMRGDDDDKESRRSIMWRAMISSTVQIVPFIGQMFSSLNYGTNPIPLIAVGDKFFTSLKQIFDAKKMTTKQKHAIRALSYAVGTWYGIPTDQARQILESLLFPASGNQKGKFY